ncbi:MAG: hypothetical protein DWQ18_05295 [Crenarchaeota archaeon]|nr:MAG: hypothetical protein DWQ17_07835 [Thermoproteota archaeon]RDJ34301.1 MAG: hypothetical protein DWQ18_05295 [Thermoproteota archaeon]RDJ36588.1 MAG: hypothetical protein DWQ13_05315 [Thermoproteota archaeon]RDJ37883.1 MAG: hypothetical protein DWQ19_05520 [Thermoproteota archaeon]
MKSLIFLLIFGLISMIPITAYAEILSFSLNKSQYVSGDSVILNGQIDSPQPGQFVIMQIVNPQNSDFAAVDTFLANSDGSFSKSYKADGPKWLQEGTYTVKVFYLGEEYQKSFQFSLGDSSETMPKNTQKQPSKSLTPKHSVDVTKEPKTHIPGFPAFDKSPQYYIDRYNSDLAFKDWFDSQFTGKNIEDVVGYPNTHTPDFPKSDRSPQYYVDWYNSANDFRDWFESQFPGETIYTVLGFPNPPAIPDWIRNNAGWWSTGKISDKEFVSSIQYMIDNQIIFIPNLSNSETVSNDSIPDWIRNNASWWSVGQITDDEFITAIKFLVEQGIIRV